MVTRKCVRWSKITAKFFTNIRLFYRLDVSSVSEAYGRGEFASVYFSPFYFRSFSLNIN